MRCGPESRCSAPFDPDLNDNSHDANVRKSIRIIAKDRLITDGWRIAQGKEPIAERPRSDTRRQFPLQTTGSAGGVAGPEAGHDLHLYAEHEFNASTFAARTTASTLADMYAASTSAAATLRGRCTAGRTKKR